MVRPDTTHTDTSIGNESSNSHLPFCPKIPLAEHFLSGDIGIFTGRQVEIRDTGKAALIK
jgi:hypothetical protein